MGVKIGAGNSPVFSGSEDDQILSRGDIGGWKSPFSWLIGVVSQRPAGKVHRRRTAIIDFNPIFQLRIFVEQTARTDVRGQKFVDHDVRKSPGGAQRVKRDAPARPAEEIRGWREIPDIVSRSPGKIDRSLRRLRELKYVGSKTGPCDIGCRLAINPQIGGIDASHRFAENDLCLSQTADSRASDRSGREKCRWNIIRKRVGPGTGTVERISDFIANGAFDVPGEKNCAGQWLRKCEEIVRARARNRIGGVAIDEQIFGSDSDDVFAECDLNL